MNGPQHYRAAEASLRRSEEVDPQDADLLVKQAQVHATLALTAATAPVSRGRDPKESDARWREAVQP